jgi:hypothetical protein
MDYFPHFYQVLFGEEAPCLSPGGQKIVKEYGDWYITPNGVYIRISSSFAFLSYGFLDFCFLVNLGHLI